MLVLKSEDYGISEAWSGFQEKLECVYWVMLDSGVVGMPCCQASSEGSHEHLHSQECALDNGNISVQNTPWKCCVSSIIIVSLVSPTLVQKQFFTQVTHSLIEFGMYWHWKKSTHTQKNKYYLCKNAFLT